MNTSAQLESHHFDRQLKKADKSRFSIKLIKTAPENDLIYEPFGIANKDDYELALSIKEKGIQESLILSKDFILLSGHRRFNAAKYLRLGFVPVRFVEIVYSELSKKEKLEQLRLFNRQREKTPGESIREKLLEINPDEAYEALKRKRLLQHENILDANVSIGIVKKRSRITTKNFLQAAQKVISENKEYWPLTVRRIHYLLLNDPPLRHDKKSESRYCNDRSSYKALTDLLIRARLCRLIPHQSIEDSTRPIQLGGGFSSVQSFIDQEMNNFLLGYSRNLMQGQPHHVEIMLEKNALRSIIEKVARDYCIPVTTGRGYASYSPRYDICKRFKQSGKNKLILLMLTDFDPDGEEIAASFARSIRDDFGVGNIHPIKVALTSEDVARNNLPSDLDAKPSSPNYKRFFQQHGSKAVELDAAPVELLQTKLRESIASVLDVEEFNAQIDLEREDASLIEAHRKMVLENLRGEQ